MIRCAKTRSGEFGSTLVEFAIGATVFLTAMFAVIEFGRALWTHNALADAARRAARYAVNQPASTPPGVKTTGVNVGPSITAIRNVAVYGDPAGGSQPMVNDLTPANVNVLYTDFGVGEGTLAVTITNYQFQFVVPIVGTTIQMPDYNTTLTGESAGVMPSGGSPPIPTPTPTPAPTATPTPAPTATPPPPLPTCTKNQVIGDPAVCNCTTQAIGNPPKCK